MAAVARQQWVTKDRLNPHKQTETNVKPRPFQRDTSRFTSWPQTLTNTLLGAHVLSTFFHSKPKQFLRWCHCCHGNLQTGIVGMFFSTTHQKPPRFFHLTSLTSRVQTSPRCFLLIKLTCSQAKTSVQTHANKKKNHTTPPCFHAASRKRPDITRVPDLVMPPSLTQRTHNSEINGTQREETAAP